MADTTKLASTFKAVRCVVEVSSRHLDAMIWELIALGLDPNPNGYSTTVRKVIVKVVVPLCECPPPRHMPTRFIEVIEKYEGNIIRDVEVDLICPLPVQENIF